MALRDKRWWRIFRVWFRWFRISLLLLVLALLGGVIYLDEVGLPGFVKRPLLERLHARGVDLQFSRVRWRWHRGLVAEDVRFGQAGGPSGPSLSVREVDLHLDLGALRRFQVQVDSLTLLHGNLRVPVPETNAPPRELAVNDIQTEVHLLPGDVWELSEFQANFDNALITLTARITNATGLRDWKAFHPAEATPAPLAENRLRQFLDTLDQIHFATSPKLFFDLRGDAREPQNFRARLTLAADGVQTPWGSFTRGLLSARLFPPTNNLLSHAEISLRAAEAKTSWAAAQNLEMMLLLRSVEGGSNVSVRLRFTSDGVETRWGGAQAARVTANWVHSLTNAVPVSGGFTANFQEPVSRWGSAREIQLSGRLVTPTNTSPYAADPSVAAWAMLAPFWLDADVRANGLQTPQFDADEIFCAARWRAPRLAVTRIHGRLYNGVAQAAASLDVASRQLDFNGAFNFDAGKLSHLMNDKSREWLAQFSWETPPSIDASGSLTLPAWTNPHPDWPVEVLPTAQVQGHFRGGKGAFRGIRAESVDSHFSYSNHVWKLPDLVIQRPEGRLEVSHEANDVTHDFYLRARSTVNPAAFRPLLSGDALTGLDFFSFPQPPAIEGELRGCWDRPETLGGRATVAITNFQFRGEPFDFCQTSAEYTNFFLKFIEPRVLSGPQHAASPGLGIDFNENCLYLTNAAGTVDVMMIIRLIGGLTERTMAPFHFPGLANGGVSGFISMHDNRDVNLLFDISRGQFEWWKFHVPDCSGRVIWVADHLAFTDVRAEAYGGSIRGGAAFDFDPAGSTKFQFDTMVTNVDLHLVVQDLASKTNKLEGRLSGQVAINSGRTGNWQTWQGWGMANLEDGLIWQIPIFGIVSPALESVQPGLGKSRAEHASGSFIITNGVVFSDNLDIHAWVARLLYRGTVDLQGRLNARAEAQPLRDTWFVGPIFTAALWPVTKLFEYKVTGMIDDPRTEPLLVPTRLLLMPFHPLRTFKEFAPASTNAPVPAPPAGSKR